MNNQINNKSVEDVLDAYYSNATPTTINLVEWIKKYPEYKEELIDFTIAWSLVDASPQEKVSRFGNDLHLQPDEPIAPRLLSELRYSHPRPKINRPSISSLVAEGRTVGLSIDQFANLMELSAAILRKLDRRLIRYQRIPLQIIEGLAHIIRREVIAIARYLNQPPLQAPGAHKSNQKPYIAAQEDFFDVVRNDPDLSDEKRDRWLALEPPS